MALLIFAGESAVSVLTLLAIAVGLSMDAFAVSVSDGLCYADINKKHALLIALTFGIYQGVMTAGGYFLGNTVSAYVSDIGHIVAFVILAAIGTKMIIEAVKENDEVVCEKKLGFKELNFQGVATSLDALAVGMGFAALNVEILSSSLEIAAVTFIICFIGVLLGKKFGLLLKKKAVIAGGIILILIGLKILLENIL